VAAFWPWWPCDVPRSFAVYMAEGKPALLSQNELSKLFVLHKNRRRRALCGRGDS
jgi:hypothetical protein